MAWDRACSSDPPMISAPPAQTLAFIETEGQRVSAMNPVRDWVINGLLESACAAKRLISQVWQDTR